MSTLCDDNNEMKKRVLGHLRPLRHFQKLHDCPTIAYSIGETSLTGMRAILLTMCENDGATRDRVLDYLRLLARFRKIQGSAVDINLKNTQEDKKDDRFDGNGGCGEWKDDGAAERIEALSYAEDLSCIYCEGVFSEENNHPKACKRHCGECDDGGQLVQIETRVKLLTMPSGTLVRSASDSSIFFWTCCRNTANHPGCEED